MECFGHDWADLRFESSANQEEHVLGLTQRFSAASTAPPPPLPVSPPPSPPGPLPSLEEMISMIERRRQEISEEQRPQPESVTPPPLPSVSPPPYNHQRTGVPFLEGEVCCREGQGFWRGSPGIRFRLLPRQPPRRQWVSQPRTVPAIRPSGPALTVSILTLSLF